MIHFELTWIQAAEVAAGLAVATVALRAAGRPRLISAATFTQESALILGLFALWQLAGSFAVMGPGGALSRARWIWRFERAVHLPSETAVQRVFLSHPLIVQFFNLYYDGLHFTVVIAVFIWLFVRHRDSYGRWRLTLVAFTGLSLLVQLIPVAPPRMLPGTGLVDTGVLYHESVYGSVAGFNADQLSAMPSVHVGWAILAAAAVVMTLRTPWRWLAVLYPAMTTLIVIVTANHFWLDGIVAAVLLALVMAAQAIGRRAAAGYRQARAAPQAVPVPAGQPGGNGRLAGLDRIVVDDDAEGLGNHRRGQR